MVTHFDRIRPRLKYICIAFGIADMTLVSLTSFCWYFIFDAVYNARNFHDLYDRKSLELNERIFSDQVLIDTSDKDLLRLERILRACDYAVKNNKGATSTISDIAKNSNLALASALIGASMGGFLILGGMLLALWAVDRAAARKQQCMVAIFGEVACCAAYILGVVVIVGNDWICSLEYYNANFQYGSQLLFVSFAVFFTFKTYEISILILYLVDQTDQAKRELKSMKPTLCIRR